RKVAAVKEGRPLTRGRFGREWSGEEQGDGQRAEEHGGRPFVSGRDWRCQDHRVARGWREGGRFGCAAASGDWRIAGLYGSAPLTLSLSRRERGRSFASSPFVPCTAQEELAPSPSGRGLG